MAEHRRDEPLIDEAVDRELDALLAVDASPEFVARLRARVAAESMGYQRSFAWGWILAGTATIVVATAIVMLEHQRPPASDASSRRSLVVVSSASAHVTEAVPQDRGDAPATSASAVIAPARSRRPSATERPALEVLISPAEAAGLRYLQAALREGRLDRSAVPQDQATADSEVPIAITPIIVEPLNVAADLE